MILNRLFISERELTQKVTNIVRNQFPKLTTGGISDNTWVNKRSAVGQSLSGAPISTNSVQLSGGTKRIFCTGYSLIGGSHVATD